MKSVMTIIGIFLIVAGIIALAYKGFTYKTEEQIAQLGDLKVTTENQNRVYFPPILGGGAIVVGIVLIILDRTRKK